MALQVRVDQISRQGDGYVVIVRTEAPPFPTTLQIEVRAGSIPEAEKAALYKLKELAAALDEWARSNP